MSNFDFWAPWWRVSIHGNNRNTLVFDMRQPSIYASVVFRIICTRIRIDFYLPCAKQLLTLLKCYLHSLFARYRIIILFTAMVRPAVRWISTVYRYDKIPDSRQTSTGNVLNDDILVDIKIFQLEGVIFYTFSKLCPGTPFYAILSVSGLKWSTTKK